MRMPPSRAATAMAFLALAAPVAPPAKLPEPAALRWAMELPAAQTVAFRGVVNFDKAGIAPVSMMYPAPNPAGLLVAVLTHAAISKGSRDAQKTKIEKEADQVLEPFSGVINTFAYADLAERSKPWALTGTQLPVLPRGAAHPDTWVVLVNPVYSITQDQTTLVLDNTIAIYAPGETKRTSYINTVRVIADAEAEPDPLGHWTADSGALLKDKSAHLLAESLDIAFADAMVPATETAFRTVRYQEGNEERMERGQPITEQCDRVLLRSLRGTLMSVPVKKADCAPSQGAQTAAAAAPSSGGG
ncbi:hypothetical protein [Luteibacter aegosomatissinici]|uniref:hypothetical protein n=1 Tax=Luteibacter aegosomatissinici TaxID=2911539 RepID=UPI001FF9AAD6|nr:hypothetical protein [Luteibacter aegosomatissinici]UPG96057.1 hypothetical protein L2Y97_08090 [Luteibacter aegosomatissinici]